MSRLNASRTSGTSHARHASHAATAALLALLNSPSIRSALRRAGIAAADEAAPRVLSWLEAELAVAEVTHSIGGTSSSSDVLQQLQFAEATGSLPNEWDLRLAQSARNGRRKRKYEGGALGNEDRAETELYGLRPFKTPARCATAEEAATRGVYATLNLLRADTAHALHVYGDVQLRATREGTDPVGSVHRAPLAMLRCACGRCI